MMRAIVRSHREVRTIIGTSCTLRAFIKTSCTMERVLSRADEQGFNGRLADLAPAADKTGRSRCRDRLRERTQVLQETIPPYMLALSANACT